MPCSLVELRQKRKLYFAGPAFFDFITFIESIFISNLTLQMMMAHSDGDLVTAICNTIMRSDVVLKKFDDLFNGTNGVGADARQKILAYLMERYVHMRGCWFVKYFRSKQKNWLVK